MPTPEQPFPFPSSRQPADAAPLPPELAEFLKDKPLACLSQATDHGTAYVIKLPDHEIGRMRGRVPIYVRHELYQHPAAPVIRTLIRIYDQPDAPLALETFINVEDPQQRADFANLAQQRDLLLLFYDDALRHRLSKRVRNGVPEAITLVLAAADNLFAAIPRERFDFDRARYDVMEATSQ